jgi:hypothetical protein
MTMKKFFRFAPLLLLVALGGGCLRAPQKLRVPSTPPPAAAPVVDGPLTDTVTEVPVVAYLRLENGEATVTRGDERIAADDGLALAHGDRITVAKGTVLIVYHHAGVSRLVAGSDVVLVSEAENDETVLTQVQVLAGSIWTRFERQLGRQEYFSAAGGGIVATVRGTAFGMAVTDGEAEIVVAENEVEVIEEPEEPTEAQEQKSVDEPKDDARDREGERRERRKVIALRSGQAFRGRREDFKRLSPEMLKTRVRKLGDEERRREDFRFGERRIEKKDFERPEKADKDKIRRKVSPDTERFLRRFRQLREFEESAAPTDTIRIFSE